MAKRFTDTEIWIDPWYRKMRTEGKIFWRFLLDRCDAAGFWKKDYELAAFQIGFEVGDELIGIINEGKKRVSDHGEHLEVVGFIDFQYGLLREEVKPHRPIIKLLEYYKNKGYRKGINTLKEQDKDTDKEKEGGVGGELYSQDFLSFWASYPLKIGKGAAWKAWGKISPADRELCKRAIEHQVAIKHFRGKDGRDFIPHPATWLNQRRWEDEGITPPAPQKPVCRNCNRQSNNFTNGVCHECFVAGSDQREKLARMKSGLVTKTQS